MKNQSSLNDIFRFVELKSANLLKAYPLIETDNILEIKDETIQIKQLKAKEVLKNIDSLIPTLKFGQLFHQEVQSIKKKRGRGTSSNEYDDDAKVSLFYRNMRSNHIDVDSSTFDGDLQILSDFIYFSKYSGQGHFSKKDTDVYIAYNTLLKAHLNKQFRDKFLNKIFGVSNNAFIKNVGVGELLVVKQHILRYEATEIAHIENVMIGETRSREHRYLDRFEETLTFENEKTVDIEKETQNEERFEMNREAQKTIEEDQKFSTDLSLSGSYGPTISFDSNLSYETNSRTSSEIKTSSTYAKDIMDRSLEKVTERVRTERITKIIKENETKNLHSFTNVAIEGSIEPKQISGIYQFVDKIYKAQVFNYGKRQMFDLMIPEPASYLYYLNTSDSEISGHGLQAPPKFDISPYEIDSEEREERQGRNPITGNLITYRGRSDNFYANLVKRYGATGIKPPPTDRVVTFHYAKPGESETGTRQIAHEGGNTENSGFSHEGGWYFYPPEVLDIKIPEKYIAAQIEVSIMAYSDTVAENLVAFTFLVGSRIGTTVSIVDEPGNPAVLEKVMEGASRYFYTGRAHLLDTDTDSQILIKEAPLKITYFSRDTANHSLSFEVKCTPSPELIKEWQLETYDTLQTAYQDRLLEFESKLAQFNADRKAQENFEKNNYGVPPSKQKQVMLTELKKHAIAIFTDNEITKETYTSNFALDFIPDNDTPPKIDRIKAKAQGDFIRFFEQAFEWSQMQFALYPYFWSKQDDWEPKFKQDDPNYEYQQFLQAGAARLVLSVRPGYEEAVAHYLEEGEIWNGEEPPQIDDPLYVSIINQIKEQSGVADKEPVPQGEPWEVRIPTNLIKLKEEDDLPKWKIIEGTDWEWEWEE